MRRLLLLSFSLLAVACSKGPVAPAAPAESAKLSAPFNQDIDVDEVMVHVMDPAARAFWAGWGETYDETGWHDISARTEAEWKKVEDGAAMVVLATNTLMLPPYQRQPNDEWLKLAKNTADLAMQGKNAAENMDKAAMEEIGGKLDVSCDACHKRFREEAR